LIYFVSLLKNEEGAMEIASYDKLYDMVQWQLESMYDEKVIMHYEACSLQTIRNAIFTFCKMGILKLS
jgi:hypothetical protein